MTESDTSRLVYALVVLVMVSSAVFARRLPMGQMAKYALAWIGIFAAGFVLFSFRGEAGAVWHRITAEFSPNSPEMANGTVRLRRGEDGHFHVNASVNGHDVLFLVDSGATTTSMAAVAARASGVETDESDFPVMISTANGATSALRGRVAELSVGNIARKDFPVLVSESFGETNMLGMNFLDSLKGWRVEGDAMILNP
jgi:aspartyl protease family protein